jgi:hypothetical protein
MSGFARWRNMLWDSFKRKRMAAREFRVRCIQPLCHLSASPDGLVEAGAWISRALPAHKRTPPYRVPQSPSAAPKPGRWWLRAEAGPRSIEVEQFAEKALPLAMAMVVARIVGLLRVRRTLLRHPTPS